MWTHFRVDVADKRYFLFPGQARSAGDVARFAEGRGDVAAILLIKYPFTSRRILDCKWLNYWNSNNVMKVSILPTVILLFLSTVTGDEHDHLVSFL